MWDSSSLGGVTAEPAVRAATSSARAVGAGLATDGMGATSTAAAPARGARVAPVATRVTGGGQVLSLVPDAALLTSPATKFPVYIDPGFTTIDKTADEQAFDPVQSDNGDQGCNTYTGQCDTGVDCRGSNFDDSINGFSPVGYYNWGEGNCSTNDTDYALYRVGIPSGHSRRMGCCCRRRSRSLRCTPPTARPS